MKKMLFGTLFGTLTALALVSGCKVGDATDDDGIGGAGGTGGTGGTGGSVGCTTPDDCNAAEDDCVVATCEDGACGSENVPAGTACTLADGDGTCDGEGACQPGDPPMGDCADSFCQLEPADAQCFACIQEVGSPGGACEDEYADCVADMSGCVAFFMGSGGSIDDPEVQALGDCVCTPGNCVD